MVAEYCIDAVKIAGAVVFCTFAFAVSIMIVLWTRNLIHEVRRVRK